MRIALLFLKLDDSLITKENSHPSTIQVQLRPPIGLMYLKSALIAKGYKVDILDQRIKHFNKAALSDFLKDKNIELVGLHVNSINLQKNIDYIECLHQNFKDLQIVAGGPGSMHYKELLACGCTAVFSGESESALVKYIESLEQGRSLSVVPGIFYKGDDEQIIENELEVQDIDSIIDPYWDKELVDIYADNLIPTLRKPGITVLASRGCIYNCAFCSSPAISSKKYRLRRVENVLTEIKIYKKKYNIKYISFSDELFASSPHWIYDFCNKLIEEKLALNWFCVLHPFSFRKDRENIFALMKEAGCDCISFGAQSSDKTVLKNINRHPDEPEELAKSLACCRRHSIKTVLTYIIGLPGDTKSTINGNIKFCLKNRPDLVDFHELVVLPGSDLAQSDPEVLPKFSKEQILGYCRKSMLSFYLHPQTVVNMFFLALKNPNFAWNFFRLAKIGLNLSFIKILKK